jgi:hypothetical protein
MAMPVDEESRSALSTPLSMTDEERDIGAFQRYLRGLTPEGLWDVHAHLDPDQYPRRSEAVRREIGRRRLFFVSPYTEFESRLRLLFGFCLGLALLAALFHNLPNFAGLMSHATRDLGGSVPVPNGGSLALAADLSPSETHLLSGLARFFYDTAFLASLASLIALPPALFRLIRHRLRPDVLLTGLIAVVIALFFLRAAHL